MSTHWTDAEEGRLAELWVSEASGNDIATTLQAEFGRPLDRYAVVAKALRMKLGPRRSGMPLLWLKEHADFDGDECLIWPFTRLKKGPAILHDRGNGRTVAARVMCEIAHGPPPSSGLDTRHLCGKGHLGCVNPKHLTWGTRQENMLDKLVHGTDNRGEKNPGSKLTETQVREIRDAEGSQRSIAERFGIIQQTVSSIKLRKIWTWMT